jgi:hypothetical protein
LLAGKPNEYPLLECRACSASFPVKSNAGIFQEVERMRAALAHELTEPCCPVEDCPNHGLGVSVGKPFYSSYGKTKSGSVRWKCMAFKDANAGKACGKLFSAASSTFHRQKASHKNKLIFKLLVNKVPLRRICEIAEIGPGTLYAKIDFIHRKCMEFTAKRESKLPKLSIPRLYLGVDRQDYAVNWTRRDDRRSTVISAMSSVDNATAYCFGLHLNFDPDLDPSEVEDSAAKAGDYGKAPPFRKHAREWLEQDYAKAKRKGARSPIASIEQRVALAYARAAAQRDVESSELPEGAEKLPENGMQIHSEYTMYGHFLYLKGLLGGVEKIRFFLDQDSGMRAACLAAFADDIKAKDRRVDVFFVSISKDLTIDQRRHKKNAGLEALEEYMAANPGVSKDQAVLALIKKEIAAMKKIGAWDDRWLKHPLPNMGEPEKAICYLTDFGDLDPDHLARLYNKASLHAVDNLFMQIRRRLMLLERGMHSQGNAGRVWNGYAPYNPKQIDKILGIFRTFHNFIHLGDDDKLSPAMRLGLAKGAVSYEDVLYFKS